MKEPILEVSGNDLDQLIIVTSGRIEIWA